MANTPQRSIRVPNEVWFAALDRAQAEGITITELLVGTLKAYGEGSEIKGTLPQSKRPRVQFKGEAWMSRETR